MTPEEKAKDLFVKYFELLPDHMRSKDEAKNVAKKFSKIAVDEIIHSHEIIFSEPIPEAFALLDEKKYWHSVKQQIDLI